MLAVRMLCSPAVVLSTHGAHTGVNLAELRILKFRTKIVVSLPFSVPVCASVSHELSAPPPECTQYRTVGNI